MQAGVVGTDNGPDHGKQQQPTSYLVQPIGTHGGEVIYFGCVCFRGELGFLNCDDICMCVVNKQFELPEFVSFLSSISLLYQSRLALFRLILVRCITGPIVNSICKLTRIGGWLEPRFVYVCQLVEVIREEDAYQTSGELGFALFGSLVREFQCMFSNMPLVTVELECHDKWCALKSPCIRVSVIIIRWPYYG